MTKELLAIFPKQLHATMSGKTLEPKVAPKTRRKNRAAISWPDCRMSSLGTAAIYATLMKKNRTVANIKDIKLALRTVLTGSRPLTSPRTLKALCQPMKA
jgi:hypothetical protein